MHEDHPVGWLQKLQDFTTDFTLLMPRFTAILALNHLGYLLWV